MSKEYIIEKIKELAVDGKTPGRSVFRKHTGITMHEINKYWETWSEAVEDAGFEANKKQKATPKDEIILKIIDLIREKGKFPSNAAYKIQRNKDPDFPAHSTIFNRFGGKSNLVQEIISFCGNQKEYEDIVQVCSALDFKSERKDKKAVSNEGYVYLIKFGEFYKIGRSNDIDRRFSEINTKLPEEGELIHVIKTDDPEGIESYWHHRYKAKRTRGEWFKLDVTDVKNFKNRKSM